MENKFEIKKFANLYLYSDVHPFEVVKVVSEKTVYIRRMKEKLIEAPVLLGVGGFGGFHDNSTQKWECVPDETRTVQMLRLGKYGWGHGKYKMEDSPKYYYDYNF